MTSIPRSRARLVARRSAATGDSALLSAETSSRIDPTASICVVRAGVRVRCQNTSPASTITITRIADATNNLGVNRRTGAALDGADSALGLGRPPFVACGVGEYLGATRGAATVLADRSSAPS